MAAPNTDNIRLGLTGGVRVAPLGTTAPTSPTATYAVGWAELGYISEDGITEATSTDTTDITAWQNGATVRRVVSSSTTTFAFTVLETNADVWRLYYPGSTFATTTGVTTVTVKVPTQDQRAFAFDIIDGTLGDGTTPRTLRIVVPKGEISERGDLVYSNGDPIGYEFTMTCYPAADGTVMLKMSNDPAVAAA